MYCLVVHMIARVTLDYQHLIVALMFCARLTGGTRAVGYSTWSFSSHIVSLSRCCKRCHCCVSCKAERTWKRSAPRTLMTRSDKYMMLVYFGVSGSSMHSCAWTDRMDLVRIRSRLLRYGTVSTWSMIMRSSG